MELNCKLMPWRRAQYQAGIRLGTTTKLRRLLAVQRAVTWLGKQSGHSCVVLWQGCWAANVSRAQWAIHTSRRLPLLDKDETVLLYIHVSSRAHTVAALIDNKKKEIDLIDASGWGRHRYHKTIDSWLRTRLPMYNTVNVFANSIQHGDRLCIFWPLLYTKRKTKDGESRSSIKRSINSMQPLERNEYIRSFWEVVTQPRARGSC